MISGRSSSAPQRSVRAEHPCARVRRRDAGIPSGVGRRQDCPASGPVHHHRRRSARASGRVPGSVREGRRARRSWLCSKATGTTRCMRSRPSARSCVRPSPGSRSTCRPKANPRPARPPRAFATLATEPSFCPLRNRPWQIRVCSRESGNRISHYKLQPKSPYVTYGYSIRKPGNRLSSRASSKGLENC